MKAKNSSRPSRAPSLALYTAGLAGISVAVAAASLLMSGCVPCEDPNGCTPTTVPQLKVTLNAKAGTYAGAQTVTISAPGAEAIYFSTDGTTPGAANCQAWDGNPIAINDSTQLRVFAKGDGVNYRSKSTKGDYNITNGYTNRAALTDWLAVEAGALHAVYCTLNATCSAPNPADFLTQDQYIFASCPGGGFVEVNVLAYVSATFSYNGCAVNGVVADGAIDLAADFGTGKVTGSGGVIVGGAGYTANIADSTTRTYRLLSAPYDETARAGSYQVACSGSNCAPGSVGYYYGTGTAAKKLWIDDPAVPNSCTE